MNELCFIIYDQSFNNSFLQKIESLQYNTALAITSAIRGTLRGKIYQELGLESPFNKDASIENYVFFSSYIKANARNNFLI